MLSSFIALAQNDEQIKSINHFIKSVEKSYALAKDTTELSRAITLKASQEKFNKDDFLKIIRNVYIANKTSELSKGMTEPSSRKFLEAIAFAKDQKYDDLQKWAEIHYAFYLYTYRHLQDAFLYYMKIIKEEEQNKFKIGIAQDFMYTRIGFFLNNIEEFNKSNKYLQNALKVCDDNSELKASIFDNIGTNYSEVNKFDSADYYYAKAEKLAVSTNDKLRYAKILGNKARNLMKQQKYDQAEKFLIQDIDITKSLDEPKNMMFAKTLLASLYLQTKRYSQSSTIANEALELANSSIYYKNKKLEILYIKRDLAKMLNQASEELHYRREIDSTLEDLKKMDGQETITQINWETQKQIFELQIEADQAKLENESTQKTVAIITSLCLLLTLLLVRRATKNRNAREKADYDKKVVQLELDKVKSENKLNATNRTIANYKEYLSEKNKQIEQLEQALSSIGKSNLSYLEKNSGDLQKLLESHLMTAENWNNFKSIFSKEYPEYYSYLTENYPELTESNLRIIILTKLDMTTNEIARILGITTDAVKKAKQRLRKKYGEKYDNLYQN